METMKIILENKNRTFNDDFYGQISGAAMGTIFPPTYATSTMGYFEVHFYNIFELKWGNEFQKFIIEYQSHFFHFIHSFTYFISSPNKVQVMIFLNKETVKNPMIISNNYIIT